jgi:hypothetical protein
LLIFAPFAQIIGFESLRTASLIVDAIYEGDKDGQLSSVDEHAPATKRQRMSHSAKVMLAECMNLVRKPGDERFLFDVFFIHATGAIHKQSPVSVSFRA